MLKKVLSLCLLVTVLASCFVFPVVEAAYTTRAVDDFETGNWGGVANSMYKSSDASGLLVALNETHYYTQFTKLNTGGYNGSAGLQFDYGTYQTAAGWNRRTALMTKDFTLAENGAAILEYKFMLPAALEEDGPLVALSGVTTGAGKFDYANSTAFTDNVALQIYKDKLCDAADTSNYFKWNVGEWYTVSTKITGTGTSRTVESYVMDDNGVIQLTATRDIILNITAEKTNFWPFYFNGNNATKPFALVADDISLTEYTDTLAPSLTSLNIENGATDVSQTPRFTFAFDQAIDISTISDIKVYKSDDAEQTSVAITPSNIGFNRFDIVTTDLDLNTTYVLDYSALKSVGGTAAADATPISFTTIASAYTSATKVDDFETGNLGGVPSWYYASSDASGLLVKPKENFYYSQFDYKNTDGYNGTNGLLFDYGTVKSASGHVRNTAIMAKNVDLSNNGAATLEYKIKIATALPEYNDLLMVLSGVTTNADGGNHYNFTNSTAYTDNASLNVYQTKIQDASDATNYFEFTVGEWYTITTNVSGTGTSRVVKTYVKDEDGEICLTAERTITKNISDMETSIWPIYLKGGIVKEGYKLVADDISLTEYNLGVKPSVLSCNITEGQQEVSLTPTFDLKFNQALASNAASKVKVYKKDDATKTSIALTPSDVTFNSFTLTPEKLDLNTEYIIDFSGVLSADRLPVGGKNAINFTTTSRREMLIAEEDFESVTTGTFAADYTTSSVMEAFVPASANVKNNVQIVADKGFEGSKGYHIDTYASGASTNIKTKTFELENGENLYIEYKLKLNKMYRQGNYHIYFKANSEATGTANLVMALRGTAGSEEGWVFAASNAGNQLAAEYDKWYTVVMKLGSTAQTVYLYGEDGTLLKTYNQTLALGNSIYANIFQTNTNKTDVVIDDIKAYRLSAHELELYPVKSSVNEGDANVHPGKSIDIAFNQPLGANAESSVAIYKGDTKVNSTVKRIGANVLRITPIGALDSMADYKIVFANTLAPLSGNGNLCPEALNFTTTSLYPVKANATNMVIDENGAIAAGDKTVTVYNYGDAIENATLVVAVYSDDALSKLIGVELFKGQTIAAGESTLTFAMPAYDDAGSATVLMYEALSTMQSLMFGYQVTK